MKAIVAHRTQVQRGTLRTDYYGSGKRSMAAKEPCMVALRSHDEFAREDEDEAMPRPDPGDWLTLQQAACELNLSVTTARRLLRKGLLRNRIVPRRGGFAYLVYLPGSRHATLGADACTHRIDAAHSPVSLPDYVRERDGSTSAGDDERVVQLEDQVESLSKALSRALRTAKSRGLPVARGEASYADDPYARYRWLARKNRWFGVPRIFSSASNASVDRLRRIVAGND